MEAFARAICGIVSSQRNCRGLAVFAVGMWLALLAVPRATDAGERNHITGIDVEPRGVGRLVHIRTKTTPTFTVFRLSDPMRVVVDISGGDVSGIQGPISVEDGVLAQIAVREFSADGFSIGRVIVGFEKEATYEVVADGNAVVISTGVVGPAVSRVAPPPVAPSDRAAAERLETVRAAADDAAKRAAAERQAAIEAALAAKQQQEDARRVAVEAEKRATEATKAKAEAEQVRRQAQVAADKDRAQAVAALSKAEERLRTAEDESRKVSLARAEAEKLAAQARRAQSDAEQTAAEAEAKAKRERADVEERLAKAASEERAAKLAKQRASEAKAEAEAAQRAAVSARVAAESTRAETSKKLEEIAAQKAALEAERRALAADKQKLADEKQALAVRQQRLEMERKAVPVSVPVAAEKPATPASSSAVGASTSLRCSGVRSSATQGGRIIVATNGKPSFETQRIVDPPRLVVDLQRTGRGTRRTAYDLKLPWAARVRLGDHNGMLRVVVDLSDPAVEPMVEANDTGVVITRGTVANREVSTVKGKGGPAYPVTENNAKTTTEPVTRASVRDVRFERHGRKAKVVVELTGVPTAMIDDRSKKAWVLQMRDTVVAKELERSLDTSAYDTVVRMVSTYQASVDPPVVNVVANLAGEATQTLVPKGNSLVWSIEGAVASAPVAASATSQTAGFTSEATAVARSVPKESRQRRVNMRLKDADLVNVVRFIADVTGENIIVSEDVKGKVTVNLRNVPWEQALDTILKSRGYDKVRQNNIIRIATATEIQQEREREVAKRKALIESGDTMVRMIGVNYATAKELVEQLKSLLSPRGSIQVDERTNTLIVEDLRENLQRVVELAKRLDRQTPQVLIEARIVEASSNFVQELGIQWGGTGQAATQYGNATGLTFPADVIASGAADDVSTVNTGTMNPSRFAVNLPAAIGAGAGGGIGFIFGSAGGGQLLSLRLSALETNGTGRIISSPRIATLDNRTAKIAQGVDIPISTSSAAGTNTRFIPANLELEVTPHVTNDGTVMLRIKTSKNEPDFANRGANGDPTIVKKSAETEVMVRDGDTAVIGGIYTRNTSDTYAEVPLLSKIPILGWLFKKKRSQDQRAELLIFITPRIVNRESALASDVSSAVSSSEAAPAMPDAPSTEPQPPASEAPASP